MKLLSFAASVFTLMSLSLCMVSCGSDEPDNPNEESSETNGFQSDGEAGYTQPGAAVDLGIPADDGGQLFWSTSNLGASSPIDRGDYFVWGELDKSVDKSIAGAMPMEVSGTAYDHARVKLGGKWRMPTWTEFKKLLDSDYCRNVVSVENGRWFVKFISKSNGNSIIMPLPGYMYNGSRIGDNTYGRYLSGTAGSSINRCKMIWMSKSAGPDGAEELADSWGYSIRPVYSE